jgi:hypothetical protein
MQGLLRKTITKEPMTTRHKWTSLQQENKVLERQASLESNQMLVSFSL